MRNLILIILVSASFVVFSRDANAFAMCAVMESRFFAGGEVGDGPCGELTNMSAQIGDVGLSKEVNNRAPVITGFNIPSAIDGNEYRMYLKAEDADDDKLSWEVSVSGNSCTSNFNCKTKGDMECKDGNGDNTYNASYSYWRSWADAGWTGMPSSIDVRDTDNRSQKEILLGIAGGSSKCFLDVAIIDSEGAAVENTYWVEVNPKMDINLSDGCREQANVGVPYNNNCRITVVNNQSDVSRLLAILPSGLQLITAENNLSARVSGVPTKDYDSFNATVTAIDEYGEKKTVDDWSFEIDIICGNDVIDENLGEICDGSKLSATNEVFSCRGEDNEVLCSQCSRLICSKGGDPYTGKCGDGEIQGYPNGPEVCDSGVSMVGKWDCVGLNNKVLCVNECSERVCEDSSGGRVPYVGQCGNGVVEGPEECDGIGGGSGQNDQYGCSKECKWEGGWLGDGVVNGVEVCEPSDRDVPCKSETTVGFPEYCDRNLSGKRDCLADGSGWTVCEAVEPTAVGGSSSQCNSTSPLLSGYKCCELVSCSQDGCACGGRSEEAGVPEGYETMKSLRPVWDPNQVMPSSTSLNFVKGPFDNTCKLHRSLENNENWAVTTIHTTASYRCWE